MPMSLLRQGCQRHVLTENCSGADEGLTMKSPTLKTDANTPLLSRSRGHCPGRGTSPIPVLVHEWMGNDATSEALSGSLRGAPSLSIWLTQRSHNLPRGVRRLCTAQFSDTWEKSTSLHSSSGSSPLGLPLLPPQRRRARGRILTCSSPLWGIQEIQSATTRQWAGCHVRTLNGE